MSSLKLSQVKVISNLVAYLFFNHCSCPLLLLLGTNSQTEGNLNYTMSVLGVC